MIIISEKDVIQKKEKLRHQFSVQHKIEGWARNMIQGNYLERGKSQVENLIAALELRAEIGDKKVPIPGLAPEGLALLILVRTGEVVLPPGVKVLQKGRNIVVTCKGKSALFRLPNHLFDEANDRENGNKGKGKGGEQEVNKKK